MTVIGAIEAGDWPAIVALEAEAYDAAGLTEGRRVLESRAAPGTSFAARAGDRVTGYVLALPFPRFHAPDLTQPTVSASPIPGASGSASPSASASSLVSASPPESAFAVPGVSGSASRGGDLHLHDLVVAAGERGRGLATRLHAHLLAAAARTAYERISLVAVSGSSPFWAALGYRPHPRVAVPRSYGAAAVYMSRGVGPLDGHR